MNIEFRYRDDSQPEYLSDYGDTYFKTAYQVGNIRNPNRKENTVIYSALVKVKTQVTNLTT